MLNVGQTMTSFDEVLSTGGALYGGKLTSVWGSNLTTTFTASYNNKGGNGLDSYDGRIIPGPSIDVHPARHGGAGPRHGHRPARDDRRQPVGRLHAAACFSTSRR